MQDVVTGNLVGRWTTPLIRVQCVKVKAPLRILLADKIVLQHGPEDESIGSRVTDGNVTISFGLGVILQVNLGGEERRGSIRVGD